MKLGKSKEETGSTFLLIKLGRNVDRACSTNISFFSNSFVLVISVPAAYSVMAIVPGMMKLSEILRQRKASVFCKDSLRTRSRQSLSDAGRDWAGSWERGVSVSSQLLRAPWSVITSPVSSVNTVMCQQYCESVRIRSWHVDKGIVVWDVVIPEVVKTLLHCTWQSCRNIDVCQEFPAIAIDEFGLCLICSVFVLSKAMLIISYLQGPHATPRPMLCQISS